MELATDVGDGQFSRVEVLMEVLQLTVEGGLALFTFINHKFDYFSSHDCLDLLFDPGLTGETSILLSLEILNLVFLICSLFVKLLLAKLIKS